jgi:hypothetical protein
MILRKRMDGLIGTTLQIGRIISYLAQLIVRAPTVPPISKYKIRLTHYIFIFDNDRFIYPSIYLVGLVYFAFSVFRSALCQKMECCCKGKQSTVNLTEPSSHFKQCCQTQFSTF